MGVLSSEGRTWAGISQDMDAAAEVQVGLLQHHWFARNMRQCYNDHVDITVGQSPDVCRIPWKNAPHLI